MSSPTKNTKAPKKTSSPTNSKKPVPKSSANPKNKSKKTAPKGSADTQTIMVYNKLRKTNVIPGALGTIDDFATLAMDGALISEVGGAEMFPTIAGRSLPFFVLRPTRASKNPSHLLGNVAMGSAYAAIIPSLFTLPAEGASITISPTCTALQKVLIDAYHGVNASVQYWIHIPLPLGASYYLEAYAPEITVGTMTRGVRWRANLCPTMPLTVGWDSELRYVSTTGLGVPVGHSGLSIVLKVIQASSSAEICEPITGVVFCSLTNINLHGLKPVATTTPGVWTEFKPKPAKPPPPADPQMTEIRWEQADVEGAQAGAIGESGDASMQPTEVSTKDTAILAKSDKVKKPTPKPNNKLPATRKPQTSAVSQKFIPVATFKMDVSQLGKALSFAVKPSTRSKKGEDIGLPWRRNVWCMGDQLDGFQRHVEFKLASSKNVSVVGLLEIKATPAAADGDLATHVAYHEIGGNFTTIKVAPVQWTPNHFDETPKIISRSLNRPSVLTSQVQYGVTVRCIAYNRTAAGVDSTITLFVRPGSTKFSVPIKPKPRPKPTSELLSSMHSILPNKLSWADIATLGEMISRVALTEEVRTLQSDVEDNRENDYSNDFGDYANQGHSDCEDSSEEDEIAPPATEEGEEGQVFPIGDEDPVDQDDFWIELPSVKLVEGVVKAIPYLPWSLTDINGAGGDNPILEKIQRFANFEPGLKGQFGPAFARYRLVLRLPTSATADVEHVSIPGDMDVETAERLFGLSSLLSIGGSVLQSVGGPLLNGAIHTVANAVKDVPLIGGLADGVADFAGALIGQGSPAPKATSKIADTADIKPANMVEDSLTGLLELPRHLSFVKAISDNVDLHDLAGKLLIKAGNFMGFPATTRAPPEINCRIFVGMKDRATFSRSIFDREDTLDTSLSLTVRLDPNQVGYFIRRLADRRSDDDLKFALKLFAELSRRAFTHDERIDIIAVYNSEMDLKDFSIPAMVARLSMLKLD